MLHVVANPAFDLDGDSGSGTSYLLYYHCKDGKVQQSTVGYYTDQFAQNAGGMALCEPPGDDPRASLRLIRGA